MSDIVRIVDKALLSMKSPSGEHDRSLHLADHEIEVAIAAAEPHLRRKHRQELLDELIAEANDHLERFPDREWSGADTEHLSYDDLYGDNPVPDALLLVGSEFGHHSIGEKIAKWLRTKEAE